MKRDPRAFLSDVIDSGRAIQQAVDGINLDDDCNSRLIRSSVEREFTIIGEALSQLSRRDGGLYAQIDQLVWGVIQDNLPALSTIAPCLPP